MHMHILIYVDFIVYLFKIFCIKILAGLNLQVMIQSMLHPQMELLVALIWRLEFQYL